LDARKTSLECELLNDMDQLSAEMVAEFPERGMQLVKDRVETVVNETGEYVREKPTQSLFYAFAVGYVLNRLPVGRVLAGFLRLLFMALKPAILIYGAARLYRSAQEREGLQR
jgi:hypothetical protein